MIVCKDLKKLKKSEKVIRVCDECKKRETTTVKVVLIGREKRGSDIDLCFNCSNLKKYRKLPNGKNHKKWKHGLTTNGYKRVFDSQRGCRVLEHTLIMESSVGRLLVKGEMVHHIDLNKINNLDSNLFLCNDRKHHNLVHSSLQNVGYEMVRTGVLHFDDKTCTYSSLKCKRTKEIKLDELSLKKLNAKKFQISKQRGAFFEMFYTSKKVDGKWQTRWKKKHVLIAELYLGRRFYRNECVHHIDGDSTNNELKNLVLMDNSDHQKAHSSLEKATIKLIDKGIEFSKIEGIYRIK